MFGRYVFLVQLTPDVAASLPVYAPVGDTERAARVAYLIRTLAYAQLGLR